jgi:antitoxin VapB
MYNLLDRFPVAISIKDPETDRLARALADATGESLTDAIRIAVAERLARETRRARPPMAAAVRRVQERLALLPVLDARRADEIVGYDAHGLPA